ncbi:MAG: hypothetical protein HQL35_08355 [Alphaproteobacteria bacterium]|nr:hypothetical protein [Alphaproteobacteria bacterium]
MTTEAIDGGGETVQDACPDWTRHPVNIRFSLPFAGGRYYVTVVAGRERRTPERREMDRVIFPLTTLGNALFGLGLATVFAVMALGLLIARSSIIEY